MVIGQLARAGFITEQETSRAGQRPERTVYALTDAGRAELRDWLAELVEQPQHEYPAFVAALSLIGALPPRQVLDLLRARLGHLAEQQAEARGLIDTARAAGVPGPSSSRRSTGSPSSKRKRPLPPTSSSASPTPPPIGPARGPAFHGEHIPAAQGE